MCVCVCTLYSNWSDYTFPFFRLLFAPHTSNCWNAPPCFLSYSRQTPCDTIEEIPQTSHKISTYKLDCVQSAWTLRTRDTLGPHLCVRGVKKKKKSSPFLLNSIKRPLDCDDNATMQLYIYRDSPLCCVYKRPNSVMGGCTLTSHSYLYLSNFIVTLGRVD